VRHLLFKFLRQIIFKMTPDRSAQQTPKCDPIIHPVFAGEGRRDDSGPAYSFRPLRLFARARFAYSVGMTQDKIQ
jgi:hypothetical protein